MAKLTTTFLCQACGYKAPRWVGKCPECDGFGTFAEEKVTAAPRGAAARARASASSRPQSLASADAEPLQRVGTGIPEFDRVLGGGVVPGSLVLIGGDPGIGKSTLLIEAAVRLSRSWGEGLYVSGEESIGQVRLRARRLELDSPSLMLAAETDLEAIESYVRDGKPAFAVIDSIQTVSHPGLDSAPGTLSQVRESATALQRLAKETGTAIFIVGHVNKEGNLAGPRALEHIVDTVLQLEGDEYSSLRLLRAAKNRFGSTHELGVFEMTERGMASVANPSQLFLSERQAETPGSVVAATIEGARPLLVEVQALCAPSYFSAPRRTVTGADFNRVNVILAVIEKRLGLRLGDMDIFVNVVGGVRVTEPALDLGIALAVVSSLRDRVVPEGACVFGEVGLAGEVRAVAHADRRISEAARLGFAQCIAPRATGVGGSRGTAAARDATMKCSTVATLREAVEALLPAALDKGRTGRTAGAASGTSAASAGRADSRRQPGPDSKSPAARPVFGRGRQDAELAEDVFLRN